MVLLKEPETGLYFAKKTLLIDDSFYKDLFENEVRVHSNLSHRYIIEFKERTESRSFVMEYANRGNIQSMIGKISDYATLRKYVLHFLSALEFLHNSGLVHNDIKPSNLLISGKDRVKLSDFAFSGKVNEVTFKNMPANMIIGTYLYKPSEERYERLNLLSHDFYASGMILYQLFAQIKQPTEINLKLIINLQLREIISKCLSGNYNKAGQIIEDINNIKF